MKQQAAESKTQLEQMEKEVAKLQQVIREADAERKRQMKELDQVNITISRNGHQRSSLEIFSFVTAKALQSTKYG